MILNKIAEATRLRVNKSKEELPQSELMDFIYERGTTRSFHSREAFAFERVLMRKDVSFICEVKKASPSKGIIAEDFPYLTIAREYEAAGADAISVLTEPEFFKGSKDYLREISGQVHIPVLRKDFIIDEYQIYEAKIIGADAILLICSLLDTKTIERFIKLCDELGLSTLVEAHNEEEIRSAIEAGARVIGVNNRNLQTFEVDIHNSIRLRELVPKEICFVAESGIKSHRQIKELMDAGVNAVLIGETLMKSSDKGRMISELRGLS
ncbi:indole-3-glycerol phosphate synthase TrpC [Mobilitalea sibirica]|uniref:Indole-3-glycerol phosphate synthase n=1 Tax=Mobilitalea sibirica TaxID=1462919 RepID=A0A8J7KWU0_9FIRM|nr:indole-3-glycerol phosphate synthase TrpC [Mobilitalea sibirica]MBH1941755.1 indole-3-glycerol phosphate synthase TrpC [Mobilitalea sibirica]